jgi:hypothetical protein
MHGMPETNSWILRWQNKGWPLGLPFLQARRQGRKVKMQKEKTIGQAEIEAIYEAIEALPDGDFFEQMANNLLSAITLIQTHVLDQDDLGAIN